MIIGIDSGNEYTGYCVVTNDLSRVIDKGKVPNDEMTQIIKNYISIHDKNTHFAIEMIASYGMPVGREVFDTCKYIGEIEYIIKSNGYSFTEIFRKDEKMTICHSMKANDSTIKQALVDRFAYGQSNYGKGTKKNKGYFYGFKADIWSAFAVCVTYHDMYMMKDGGYNA